MNEISLEKRLYEAFDKAMNIPEDELPRGLSPDALRPPFIKRRRN